MKSKDCKSNHEWDNIKFLFNKLNSQFILRIIFYLILFLIPTIAYTFESVTATKDDYGVVHATFTITSAQEIVWEAIYTGTPGPEGNSFYLHTPGALLNEIPLSTNLSAGYNTGTHYLDPGTYNISIEYMFMGPGTYTINYNHTASIEVSPISYGFGSYFEGENSPDREFHKFNWPYF